MTNYIMGEVEMKFANLIWQNEPIASGELVKLADTELSWKKSTTYTIIRKLCDKGFFVNLNGTVSSLISKDDYILNKSERFVEETFSGSLPNFITAFSKRQRISKKDIEEIQRIIDQYKEG